ncbi:MAG: ABC transporter ATP-binding protein [Deltaproteobacteria bacterium]|nr:ABC transporter ATP-binding protein [Deltaproteobacteria bacterium]
MENSNSTLLAVHDLRKNYGKNSVLNGLNLQVNPREIHVLVGLNGAGKTTTIECVLGLKSFDSGSIHILDCPPSRLHTTNCRLAVVFDSPCIHPNLTVGQALKYASITCGNKNTASPKEVEGKLNISRYRNYKIKNLSLGNRRRASIAQALIGRPEFIILDEPFSSLDAGGVDDLLLLIKELNRKDGITFLLASHQLPYLERICSHVSILHRGQIAMSISTEELFRLEHTRALLHTNGDSNILSTLSNIPGVTICNNHLNDGIMVELDGITTAQLNRELNNQGVDVHELIRMRPSLDSLFRKVTGSNING